ncbi:13841_t:CDS:2 [Gigaspora margarita]|uniref:13841_t:CDS:1 n=1 Tax=Gigaspora margarita TaxID=4874 RepID=A0ABN7V9F3_GIGMA|nr:13841_t:CDS:2 [Gigaspora margarita]
MHSGFKFDSSLTYKGNLQKKETPAFEWSKHTENFTEQRCNVIDYLTSVTRSEAYKNVAFEEVTEDVQSRFNGLMEVLGLVSAVDTSKNNYLEGYKPYISIISKDDAADGALVPRYIYTVLELKKPKHPA